MIAHRKGSEIWLLVHIFFCHFLHRVPNLANAVATRLEGRQIVLLVDEIQDKEVCKDIPL